MFKRVSNNSLQIGFQCLKKKLKHFRFHQDPSTLILIKSTQLGSKSSHRPVTRGFFFINRATLRGNVTPEPLGLKKLELMPVSAEYCISYSTLDTILVHRKGTPSSLVAVPISSAEWRRTEWITRKVNNFSTKERTS